MVFKISRLRNKFKKHLTKWGRVINYGEGFVDKKVKSFEMERSVTVLYPQIFPRFLLVFIHHKGFRVLCTSSSKTIS